MRVLVAMAVLLAACGSPDSGSGTTTTEDRAPGCVARLRDLHVSQSDPSYNDLLQTCMTRPKD